MISPQTPPGTEVVCIDASDLKGSLGETFINPLVEGAVYTVVGTASPKTWRPAVILHEIKNKRSLYGGFWVGRFRYLHRAADPSFYAVEREKENAE